MNTPATRISLLEQTVDNLEKRFDKIEASLDKLREEYLKGNKDLHKTLIATFGTIVVGFLGVIAALLS